ncbi:helix-turn-helix domain-containing protein [Kitasatospora sp. NPDC049285]|uniref:helix-turn-helix domain-containing protein n=1 Tax=Kitasatospora sp. NPDC049285 TaxID=3157096 RepID=UPI00342BB904
MTAIPGARTSRSGVLPRQRPKPSASTFPAPDGAPMGAERAFWCRFPAAWLTRYTGDTIRTVTTVADYARRSGSCWASNATLASALGLHEKTVAATLREVEGILVLADQPSPNGTLGRRARPVGEDELAVTISSLARNALSGHRFKVYCAISLRSDLGLSASASALAQACGMSAEACRTIARDLVADGWVSRDAPVGRAPKYDVHPAPVAGAAAQLALFAQPRQSARPEGVPGLEGDVADPADVVCEGQLALFGEGSEELLTPLVPAPVTPLLSLPQAPLVAAPQTGHLQQAHFNKPSAVDGCFSRVADTLVTRDAHAREDVPAGRGPVDAFGRPLRGDKQASRVGTGTKAGNRSGQQSGVRLLRWDIGLDVDLRVALQPAEDLLRRVTSTSTREFLAGHVRAALGNISRWTGAAHAPTALAERLTWRLKRQGGSALVDDPIGWMLRRGLPQGQSCSNQACDDGIRLDSGADCVTCELRVEDRRTTRAAVAGQVLAEMPDATDCELQAERERRLHDLAMRRSEALASAEREAEQRRLRYEAERDEREAREAAAEAARLAVACEDCQAPQSAGLCLRCSSRRGTRVAMVETVNFNLAMTTLTCWDDVRAVVDRVNAEITGELVAARNPEADRDMIAASDRVNAETYRDRAHHRALQHWARSAAACEEAELASAAELRRAHRYETRSDAEKAAFEAGERARLAAARELLEQQLRFVRSLRRPRPNPATPSVRAYRRDFQECS